MIHSRSDAGVPVCGRADWSGLSSDPLENECWECESITGEPREVSLFDELLPELADEYLNDHTPDMRARANAEALGDLLEEQVHHWCGEAGPDKFWYHGTTWVPVDHEAPFADLEAMAVAFLAGGEMQVSDLHHDHPVFSRLGNLRFRVWHDTAHLVHGLGFSVEDELELFVKQAEGLPTECVHALFCESVYQLAAFVRTGSYPDVQRVRTPGPAALRLLGSWGL